MKCKKTILLILSLFTYIGFISGQEVSIISGKWIEKADKINLYAIDNGQLKEIASSSLVDNNFLFAINQTKADFYIIGKSFPAKNDNYTFYMKPGDKLNVEIDNANFDYTLIGDNTPENKEMKKWFEMLKPADFIATFFHKTIKTYVDFFPLFETLLEQEQGYTPTEPVSKEFETRFAEYRKIEMLHASLRMLYTPRTAHPKVEDYIDFYKNISFKEITSSDALLDYPYGILLLGNLKFFKNFYPEQKKISREEELDENISLIANDILKGEVVVDRIKSFKDYEELMTFNQKYEKYLITERQQNVAKEQMITLAKTASGTTAVDFKFKDRNGKIVALSDFKGKVVYVDIWATWCGPCKKEAPYWKALSEKYKGKDVVFLGVSIDVQADYNKWIKYLDDEGEVGVQLFAGDNADDIQRPYQVKGIPHFLLIGKDGKIILGMAPRPSHDEKILIALDAALAK